MNWTDFLTLATGAVFALAGALGVRRVMLERLMDKAIAALAAKRVPAAQNVRTLWLAGASWLTAASGLLLMADSALAAVTFVIVLAAQAAFVLWAAPRWFDTHDPPEPGERAATLRSLGVYALVTALVVAAAARGWLQAPPGEPVWPLAAAGIATFGLGAWTLWHLLWSARGARRADAVGFDGYDGFDDFAPGLEPGSPELPPEERLLVVAPVWRRWLFDPNAGLPVDDRWIETSLPETVQSEGANWAWDHSEAIDPDDPARVRLLPSFDTPIRRANHASRAAALADSVRQVWPGRVEVWLDGRAGMHTAAHSLTLAARYGFHPIETLLPGQKEEWPGLCDPHICGLSLNLAMALHDWSNAYDDAHHVDGEIQAVDGLPAGWSEVERLEHLAEGERLVERMRTELSTGPGARVIVTFGGHRALPGNAAPEQ